MPYKTSEKNRARARKWIAAKRAANREAYNAQMREWRAQNRAKNAYMVHKGVAKRKDIQFSLTFEEWMQIWIDSGKWEQRGRLAGQYVMARYGDVGPYAVGNVRICTFGENVREAHCGKVVSDQTRAKQSEAKRRNPPPRDGSSGRYVRVA